MKIYKKINQFYRKKLSEMDEDRRCMVEGFVCITLPLLGCIFMFYGILGIYKMF